MMQTTGTSRAIPLVLPALPSSTGPQTNALTRPDRENLQQLPTHGPARSKLHVVSTFASRLSIQLEHWRQESWQLLHHARETVVLRSPRGEVGAHVSREWFRVYWLVILLIYFLDGTFLVGVSGFYLWLLFNPVVVINVQNTLHVLPIDTLRALVWVFPVLAVGHLVSALQLLVFSYQQKQLALVSGASSHQGFDTRFISLRTRLWLRVDRFLTKWVNPFFTLEGNQFEVWFTIQEIFQIVSQTYQCYSLSRLVSTDWINLLSVFCAFLNCVSSPVVRLVVHRNRFRQRLLCVVADCCLGFVQSAVIPLIMVYPFYRDYNTDIQYFPDDLVYNDQWFIETVHQLDQLLIESYFDFVTTALPHLSFLRSLRGVCRLLKPVRSSEEARLALAPPVIHGGTRVRSVVPHESVVAKVRSGLHGCNSAVEGKDEANRGSIQNKHSCAYRASAMYGALCIAYGFLLLIVHWAATKNDLSASQSCKSHLSPWFTSKYACSIVSINCFRGQIQGTKGELARILQEFDANSVLVLLLSHCPSLEIPVVVRDFHQLMGIDIYNSTLVEWSVEAAVDASSNPSFNYLAMEIVNLSSLPVGVYEANLSNDFADVELRQTNLSVVPEDIGIRWPNLNTLYLEFCDLKAIPTSIMRMPLWDFSVVGNAIEFIDDDFFAAAMFNQLLLSNNPLQQLPNSLGDGVGMYAFSFEHTQVNHVPTWVVTWALDRTQHRQYLEHSAFGTPFCDSLEASSSHKSSDSTILLYHQTACAKDLRTSRGYIPVDSIAAQRPL